MKKSNVTYSYRLEQHGDTWHAVVVCTVNGGRTSAVFTDKPVVLAAATVEAARIEAKALADAARVRDRIE